MFDRLAHVRTEVNFNPLMINCVKSGFALRKKNLTHRIRVEIRTEKSLYFYGTILLIFAHIYFRAHSCANAVTVAKRKKKLEDKKF